MPKTAAELHKIVRGVLAKRDETERQRLDERRTNARKIAIDAMLAAEKVAESGEFEYAFTCLPNLAEFIAYDLREYGYNVTSQSLDTMTVKLTVTWR